MSFTGSRSIPAFDSSQVGMGILCQRTDWCPTHHLLSEAKLPCCPADADETNPIEQRYPGERMHQHHPPPLYCNLWFQTCLCSSLGLSSSGFSSDPWDLWLFTPSPNLQTILYLSPTWPLPSHQSRSNSALGPESRLTMFSCRSCTPHNLKGAFILQSM